MEKTGLYVRISRDTEREGLGVARQLADCRSLAERRGWTRVEVYEDNDLSAYSGRPRPAYLRLLEDIRTGKVRRIVAWHPDRLHRSPVELESFIDLVEESGCQIETVRSGAVDLTTPAGRLNARVLGGFARYESEHRSDRVRSKLAHNAAAGKHHGGTRPYGWQDDRVTLDEDEAEHVRTAARLLLAGNSAMAVARALNATGSRNTSGTEWSGVTVRSLLIRPRNAGLRQHHGRVLEGVKGLWEPILDADTYEQVRVLLSDPARRTNPGSNGRTYLLSGIARCGICHGPVRGAKGKPYKGIAATIYRCFPSGCVSRNQESVDSLARRLICARLVLPDAVALLRPAEEPQQVVAARAEVERLRAKLETVAADEADDLITREQYLTQTRRLRARLEQAESRVPAPEPRLDVLDGLVGQPDVEGAWDRLDVSVQRQVVDLLLSITINKTRRGPGFDERSVRMEWK
ncbi:MAG: recombinase family protein, partial [Actinobacteria bacterium]|nr:recombinase family protein [Actinomycetota bacterium]MCA1721598.1 recombinase family protein [Actinomycetota bacterium]